MFIPLFYFFELLFDLCYFCANFAPALIIYLIFMEKINVAVFVSGSGSNFENLVDYFRDSEVVNIALMVSNRADAYALVRAQRLKIPSAILSKSLLSDPSVVLPLLRAYGIGMVVLAGFLPMVPDYLINLFPRRIINIHPALLPKFGGKGMWGHHVHEAVKAAGETQTGITVHYVSPVCDGGEIIAQYSVDLSPEDTVDDIAAKGHELEMAYFPQVVEKVAREICEKDSSLVHSRQILLINDIAGYGKVATAAMLPILSYMGLPVYNLPTCLVSNTLDYGKFNLLDTTDYITGVFPVWKELGFSYDAIATGFIASSRQAQIVSEYCLEQAALGTLIFVDPIMGDEGKLYNGVTPATIQSMLKMVSVAHLTCPNYTEACYLTGTPYREEGVTAEEARAMLESLRALGCKSVVVTSMLVDGQHCVAGYNHFNDEYFSLDYTEIPVHFPGTGDIFSAVLFGHLLRGELLVESTRKAMDVVARLIDLNKGNADKNRGIPLERYLYLV